MSDLERSPLVRVRRCARVLEIILDKPKVNAVSRQLSREIYQAARLLQDDDDLTIGSIDPYQVFRIFHEILSEPDASVVANIAFMIDQSHNLKGKMEAMVQTVVTAQELFLKAALVDRERLAELQAKGDIVRAEECLRQAFWHDVRPALREWRRNRALPENPLEALRASGYVERAAAERGERNASRKSSYA